MCSLAVVDINIAKKKTKKKVDMRVESLHRGGNYVLSALIEGEQLTTSQLSRARACMALRSAPLTIERSVRSSR